jgi:hypothetical protein
MKKLLLAVPMIVSVSFANAGSLTDKYERDNIFDAMTSSYMMAGSCEDSNSQLLMLKGVEGMYKLANLGYDPYNLAGTDIEFEWNSSRIRSVGDPVVRNFNQLALSQGSKKSQDFIAACNDIKESIEYFYDASKGVP